MTKTGKKPPKIAEWLLKIIANQQSNSAIIGDLEKEFSALAENRNVTYAFFWYWKLIIISLPSFVKNRLYWSLTMFENYLKISLEPLRKNAPPGSAV